MGGTLSGFTFDLFDTIASLGEIDVRFLYSPIDGLPSFQHENTVGRARNRLWWKDASWRQIRRFVRVPSADAVFVYGNRPRVKMNVALAQIPRNVPVFYVADTNITDLMLQPAKTLMRHLACLPIARRATAALSLGLTNHLAMRALGFDKIVELPVCVVDFATLDAAVGQAEPRKPSDEMVVLVVARLAAVKNLPGFVGALARQLDLSQRIRLIIAGEGPDRPTLEEIKRCFPNLKMQLLGAVGREEIGALLGRADVLLLPSLVEPWGIAVVEALGMGLPVIATPAVGAAVSLAGSTGGILLSDSAEPLSILQAIRRFLDRRSELARAASQCAPYIRSRYDRVEVAKEAIRLVYGAAP
jgi:glycosyltransferase involved in cell wall biosynthesis